MITSDGVQAGTRGGRTPASDATLRAPAFAALALGLVAVVGLASSSSAWDTASAAGAPSPAVDVMAALGGVVLVAGLLVLWAQTPGGGRRKKGRAKERDAELREPLWAGGWSAGKTIAVVLLALGLFCLSTLPLLSQAPQSPDAGGPARNGAAPGGAPVEPRGRAGSVDLSWLLLPAAATLAVLAPAVVLIRRRRLRAAREGTPEAPVALGAVRASIAALRAERDPRRAIMRAYAHMEHAFGDVEIVRGRDETASEFLARTTRRLPVSGEAAALLTGRFEEARFSTHPLSEADREQALAALQRVEGELADRP